MKVLLDTHAFIWAAMDAPELSKKARAVLSSGETKVWVSAITAWEIAIKAGQRKLPQAAELADQFADVVQGSGYTVLPITVPHALRTGRLALHHKDPFDRMLIAQALAEDIALVSNEEIFDAYQVRRIW